MWDFDFNTGGFSEASFAWELDVRIHVRIAWTFMWGSEIEAYHNEEAPFLVVDICEFDVDSGQE